MEMLFSKLCNINSKPYIISKLHRINAIALNNKVNYKTNAPNNKHIIDSPTIIYLKNKNIFENLALENWIYKNIDLSPKNARILMLWVNNPCIVVGRHQNVFAECNISKDLSDVDICRRYSGGGTVYHDTGTLCVTFFTHRDQYRRSENLELVMDCLNALTSRSRRFANHLPNNLRNKDANDNKNDDDDGEKRRTVDSAENNASNKINAKFSINTRDDLTMDECFKISGTAAKLGRSSAYHHLTLLVNTDLEKLNSLISSPLENLKSRATSSTRSKVKNINDLPDGDFSMNSIMNALQSQFEIKYNSSKAVQHLDIQDLIPDDQLKQEVAILKSWENVYAFTPPFSVVHRSKEGATGGQLSVSLEVTKGRVSAASVDFTSAASPRQQQQQQRRRRLQEYLSQLLTDHLYLYKMLALLPEEIPPPQPPPLSCSSSSTTKEEQQHDIQGIRYHGEDLQILLALLRKQDHQFATLVRDCFSEFHLK